MIKMFQLFYVKAAYFFSYQLSIFKIKQILMINLSQMRTPRTNVQIGGKNVIIDKMRWPQELMWGGFSRKF